MYHALSTCFVLAINPTISKDIKDLQNRHLKAREAARVRLQSLPAWTAECFNYYADKKSTDLGVRLRCKLVYEKLISLRDLEIGRTYARIYKKQ